MVNGITTWIAPDDAATKEAHGAISDIVLTGQLDPSEVARTLADLTEAENTSPETLLPGGIGEPLAGGIGGLTPTGPTAVSDAVATTDAD